MFCENGERKTSVNGTIQDWPGMNFKKSSYQYGRIHGNQGYG